MFNLLSTLVAVVALAIMTPGIANFIELGSRQSQMAATARQEQQVYQAAQGYLQQYYSLLVTATAGATQYVTPAMLVNTGFLPGGFNGVNPYGQGYLVEITQPPLPNNPGQLSGNLQALIVTTGGQPISERDAAGIAAMVGQSGGYVPNRAGLSASNAIGAFGSWTQCMPGCGYASPGPGHLASLLYVNNGQVLSPDTLYRVSVPGHPELNTMFAPLNMGNQQIQSVSAIGVQTMTPQTNLDIESTANPAGPQQILVNSPQPGPAGISLSDSTGWNVKLRTNSQRSNWLELADGSGNVVHAWRGNEYYPQGFVAPNAGGLDSANPGWGCSQYGAITTSYSGSGILQCTYQNGNLIWQSMPVPPVDLGTFYPWAPVIGTGFDEGGTQTIMGGWVCLPSDHNWEVQVTWLAPISWYEPGRNDIWMAGYVESADSWGYQGPTKSVAWEQIMRTADWDNGGGPLFGGASGVLNGPASGWPGGDCLNLALQIGGDTAYIDVVSSSGYLSTSWNWFFSPSYSYMKVTGVPLS